ncbi:MAG TPA: hypothetical protein VG348_15875 [Acidimicrobiia bacterium]|jgi:hypothetical protein|nr:hypothetical protein [Acidimicrobiia bacterium]
MLFGAALHHWFLTGLAAVTFILALKFGAAFLPWAGAKKLSAAV